MVEQTFATAIRNERKTGVTLWEARGSALMILGPGQSIAIETWNPDTMFAPFSIVTYKEDGTVDLVPNPDYPATKFKWLITCWNRDGKDLQRRIIGGREVVLPKGFRRTFELEVNDPLAIYNRMEIKEVMERTPSPQFADYNEFNWELRDVFYDRPEPELKELASELEKLSEKNVVEPR